jgi:hypothetical protein
MVSACVQPLVDEADEALDRAHAAATFDAAAKTAIDLLGIARKVVCGIHGMTHVVIAQHVAGTDDHWGKKTFFDDAAISPVAR